MGISPAQCNILYNMCKCMLSFESWLGAPVAQWVKRWPTDLAVPGSILARGEIFPSVNGVPLHTAFHYYPPIVLI